MKTLMTPAALALPLIAGTQAKAHATFAETTMMQGQTARLTLRVPHGGGDEATLRLRVQIPEGLIAAQPMVKPGWTLETVTGAHAMWHAGPVTLPVAGDWTITLRLLTSDFESLPLSGTLTLPP